MNLGLVSRTDLGGFISSARGSQFPGELGLLLRWPLPMSSLPKGFPKYMGRKESQDSLRKLWAFPQLLFSQLSAGVLFWVGKFLRGEDGLVHCRLSASLDSRQEMLVCNNQEQIRNAPVHFQTPLGGCIAPGWKPLRGDGTGITDTSLGVGHSEVHAPTSLESSGARLRACGDSLWLSRISPMIIKLWYASF